MLNDLPSARLRFLSFIAVIPDTVTVIRLGEKKIVSLRDSSFIPNEAFINPAPTLKSIAIIARKPAND